MAEDGGRMPRGPTDNIFYVSIFYVSAAVDF